MGIFKQKNYLDKKPIWYLFLLANISVVIGVACTWILLVQQNIDWKKIPIPSVVCNFFAFVFCGLFIYLEMKSLAPKIMHFQRKWLIWYTWSIVVFIIAIVYGVIFYILYLKNWNNLKNTRLAKNLLIIYFVGTVVLTLISIGIQRYAYFHIDLDLYKRWHGQEKENEKNNNNPQKQTSFKQTQKKE